MATSANTEAMPATADTTTAPAVPTPQLLVAPEAAKPVTAAETAPIATADTKPAAETPAPSDTVKPTVPAPSAPAPAPTAPTSSSAAAPTPAANPALAATPAPVEPTPVKPLTKALSPSAPIYVPPSLLAHAAAAAAASASTTITPSPATPTRARLMSDFSRTPRTPSTRTPTSRTPTARTPGSRGALEFGTPSTPSAVELSAKQVRELRRLCRKTANRAEYEGRLVQLRQIASILAMGGPSLVHFAPSYLAADSAMQSWLDACRSGGADWRDERPLSAASVEELREWDRLLKAWARRRFPTLDSCADGAAPPTTPRAKRPDILSLSSPVSGDSPSPARAAHTDTAPRVVKTPSSGRRRVSRMSIQKDGDIINISIVRAEGRTTVSATSDADSPRSWRAGSPARDQENVAPAGEETKNRDWGTLRKAAKEAAESTASTALKPRNW